jgi:TldD protein
MDTPLSVTDRLFHADLAPEDALKRLREGTQGAEDGELFLEYRESEAISLDDGRIRSASYDTTRGFGLRAVHGEAAGYAHSGEISDAALARAATTVQAVRQGRSGTLDVGPRATNARLYEPTNPLTEMDFAAKTALLMEIDAHARALDPRVVQVSASITGEWQAVQILRPDGSRVADIRPLVRFNVSIVVEENGRRETGSFGTGGRFGYARVLENGGWQSGVAEALRQALVNLSAVAAPAGEQEVVLGSGWPGILLHEAIGHGLEGDFNRKKTSAFAGLLGQRIAAPGVTVMDDGTIPDRRGSITVDDEGTPSGRMVHDRGRLPARLHPGPPERPLMGVAPTGNAAPEPRPCADAAHDLHLHARLGSTPPRRSQPRARRASTP